jgi:hypothetical protein
MQIDGQGHHDQQQEGQPEREQHFQEREAGAVGRRRKAEGGRRRRAIVNGSWINAGLDRGPGRKL